MRVPTAVPAAAAGGTPPAVSMEARQRSLHARALQRHASPAGDPPDLSVDALVDSVLAIYHDVKQTVGDNPNFAKFLKRFDPIVGQLNGLRISTNDFEIVQKLASGAFGTVSLVRGRHDGKLYALKALKKKEVMKQENVFFMEERNVMAFVDSKWITRLYASFQDDQHLYLVMEYLPGGDLISLLDTRDDSIISEPEARFYMAELIVAVAELHQRHFAHRDLKPHNILIDKSGHIKLADFGSCIQVPADGKIKSSTSVGTPDYVSPEVLDAQNGRGNGYGIECDWWSVGIILYEVLCGDPPFLTDSLSATYAKIQRHKGNIKFPDEVDLSPEVKDLINRLLTPPETRLGRNGVAEIQAHPWFAGIDWTHVEDLTPTFVPSLASDTDTRYFSPDEGDGPSGAEKSDAATLARGAAPQRAFMGHHLPFIGYTYLRPSGSSQQLNQVAGAAEATATSADGAAAVAAGKVAALETQLAAEKTKAAIVPTLEARIKELDAQLVEEKSRGTTKSAGLEAQIKQLETQLADAKSRYDTQLGDTKARHDAQLADAVAAVQAKLELATAAAEQDTQRAKANADKLAQDLAAARRAVQDTADDWSKRYDALNAAKVKADAAAVAAQDSAARRAAKLDADLAEARANVARLTAQAAETEVVVKGLREAVAERDRNLARQKTEMTHKDEDLAKMRKEQTLIEIAARGKSEQAGVQATQLGQELSHVKEELKVERERKQKAETALAEATLGIQQLSEQVEAAAAQIAALNTTVAGKDAEIAALKAQVDEATNELEVAKEQAAVKSAEVAQLTDRTVQLETDRRAAQDERDSVAHKLAETDKALGDLQAVHDRTQMQLADAHAKVDELTAVQQQRELTCRTHLADLAAMGHAKHVLDHDLAQLVAEKATLEKNIDGLNAKLSAAELAANEKRGGGFFGMKSGKRGEKMQQELVNAENRCAELEAELVKLRKQLADVMGQSVDEVMAIGSAHAGSGTSRATSTHSGLGVVGPHPTETIAEDDRRNGRGFMARRMTRVGKKPLSSKIPLESVGEGETPPLTFGFLKVYLKSGKSKLDWKRSDWAEKYVVVQGGKVFMADSKEHADDLAKNGTQLVDLTLDFVAIAGLDGIAELQKVKAKENLCVFKVQTMSRTRPVTESATGGGTSSPSTLGKGVSMPSMSSMSGAPASPTLPAAIGSDGSGGGMSVSALPPAADTTALEAKLKDTHARIAVETTFIQVHQRMGGMHKAEGKVGVDKANAASKERLRILEVELQQMLAQQQAQMPVQELLQRPQSVPLSLSIPQLSDSPSTPDSPCTPMPPPEMPARTLPGGPPPRDEPPLASSSSSSTRRLGPAAGGPAPRPQSICIGTSNAALVPDTVRRTRTSSEAADMPIPPTPSTPMSLSPSTPFALSGSPSSTKVIIGGIDYDHVAGHYFKSDTLDMSTNCRSCYEFIEFNPKGKDSEKLKVKSCVMCDYHVHPGCFERTRNDPFLLPCDAVRALKSTGATTVMFMAASAENKREWIKTFEWCRRQHLRALAKKQTASYVSADNMSATSHGFDVSHSGSEQHLASIRGSATGSVRGSTAGV